MAVSIKEVRTKRELRQFAKFPNVLYKNNKYYVPQLISMDMATFSPKKNRAFEVCEGKYWLAYKDGELVGRVAGIINHKYNRKVGQNICRFGWIDFTNDPEVVHALLDTVESYARANGMNVVEGPVGFLEFDVAGVLVDGFDQYPTAYGKYNDPYYEPLILAEGYKKETDYVEFRVTVPENIDRYEKLSKLIGERLGLHEATFKNKKDLVRKYADGIFGVLNHAYSSLHGFSELSQAQCEDLKKQFLPQLILDYVSVIVDKDDKVVAFGITLPSLSKALIKAKGHLFPFGWYHILHALKHNDTIDALLVAISDEYKDKGVNAMLIAKMGIGYHKHGIKYLESTRELESNMAVQNMWGHFERKLHKRARVYIKKIK
ncbi:MAG: N-acetyltransferase [Bacteroidales bacterium]|nr:N-acetyltransferase [Bacteroidales bacterium]MDY6002374.1 N-acetyltransferase [Candidatus Cryptobacteroides sp.]